MFLSEQENMSNHLTYLLVSLFVIKHNVLSETRLRARENNKTDKSFSLIVAQ